MKFKYFFWLFFITYWTSAQTFISGDLPCNTVLSLSSSPYVVDASITVLSGCTLTVEAGVEIKMNTESYFNIEGSANFKGTAAMPIHLHALNDTWRLIYLDSTLFQKSYFNYVIIEDATYGPDGFLPNDTTFQLAAISGYYSSFEITHCTFKNNQPTIFGFHCPDAIISGNIIDSTNTGEKLLMQHCDRSLVDSNYFYFTAGLGDAIDFDASENIVIRKNRILGGDSDGIDLGNHDTTGCYGASVYRNFIQGMGDKGLSCGEKCTVNAHHNVIVGCDIGIASKAGSHVQSDHNTLFQNRIGLKSFDKGDGWGVGDLTVTNSIIAASIDSTWSKDNVSELAIIYSLSDIELMPGVNNIKADPSFQSPANSVSGNFYLVSGSAAINSGDPNYTPDPDGTRTDMGAFYFNHPSYVSNTKSNVNKSLLIYPNPADDFFVLQYDQSISNTYNDILECLIFNTQGKLILSETLETKKINLEKIYHHLDAGMYFVKLKTATEEITGKLTVR